MRAKSVIIWGIDAAPFGTVERRKGEAGFFATCHEHGGLVVARNERLRDALNQLTQHLDDEHGGWAD
jgi:hypothetical protein